MPNNKPLVAIHCLVYNHEPYLRDCLEGFVMQKTNFPFVAIIHDDASSDGSAAVIREYEKKYPDIIKPIYEIENFYTKHNRLVQIMNAAIESTGAKYIAMCEGDDYWIDPRKLQKQVDFMETHPEYSLCFHKVKILIQGTGEIKEEFIVRDMPGKSTISDLAKGNYIHTPSVLYRKFHNVQEQYQKMMPCLPGDYVMWMLQAEKGDLYKFEEPMAIYRYGSGVWSTSHTVKNDVAYLGSLNRLYVTITDEQARKNIQEQIMDITESIIYMEHDLHQIRTSKAYCLGKVLVRLFKWLKK